MLVSWFANEAPPTRVATYVALPLTQMLPESTVSPGPFGMRSDSPVSSDSSTSIAPDTTRPSRLSWSPRLDHQCVTQDGLVLVGDLFLAVAEDRCRWSRQDAEPVQRLFGAALLETPTTTLTTTSTMVTAASP